MKTSKPRSLLPALVASLLVAWGTADASAAGLELGPLSAGERLIPLRYEHGGYQCTHLKLPDLLLRNNAAESCRVRRIDVVGSAAGGEVCRLVIQGGEIEQKIAARGRWSRLGLGLGLWE